ncbi:AraC family transcriptional regulator [Dongshaea marina]|uniref:AraC family transcriptional regulator n=1 Tax=Dongshaea marina TaxID=2047966 RepID=UPI000D3E294D|nr:helix-turn-helix transcriptional regulator [Dongshaea marina]
MSNRRQLRPVPDLNQLPRPVFARIASWDHQGTETRWHHHAWGQWVYAIEGVLEVHTRRARYFAPPQFAVWIPQGEAHQIISGSAAKMRSLYIETDRLPGTRWSFPCVCEVSPLVRELVMTFCEFPAEYPLDSPHSRLVQVLLDAISELPLAANSLPLPFDKRLLLICEKLQARVNLSVNMEQLGSEVGLSGRSVSRLFKSQTGLSFQQWRQRLRLLHGVSLLEKGESITNIALACGYDSLSAFVAAFKKQFGRSPGQYFG